MNTRWVGILVVCFLWLGAITGCGGDSKRLGVGVSPSEPDLVACLERTGADVEVRDVDSTFRMAEAQLPGGDQVFIGRLPNPSIAEKSIQTVRRIRREERLGGIMTASTVDGGWILVLVIGHEGMDGGVPADASGRLARKCAIQTGARIARRSAGSDGIQIARHLDHVSWMRSVV